MTGLILGQLFGGTNERLLQCSQWDLSVCVGRECRGWGAGVLPCEGALVGTFTVAWGAERVACVQLRLNGESKRVDGYTPCTPQQDNIKPVKLPPQVAPTTAAPDYSAGGEGNNSLSVLSLKHTH